MQIGPEVYKATLEGGGFGKSASSPFGQIGNLPLSDQCFCKLEGKLGTVNASIYTLHGQSWGLLALPINIFKVQIYVVPTFYIRSDWWLLLPSGHSGCLQQSEDLPTSKENSIIKRNLCWFLWCQSNVCVKFPGNGQNIKYAAIKISKICCYSFNILSYLN